MNLRIITLSLLLSLSYNLLSAQNYQSSSNVHFSQSSSEIEVTIGDNDQELEKLAYILEEIKADSDLRLVNIELNGYASPEGSIKRNDEVTLQRLESGKQYIKTRFNIPDSLITVVNHGVAWEELRKLVSNSNMDYKDDVLAMFDSTQADIWWKNEVADSRNKQMMDIKNGVPYLYMLKSIFPKLRETIITIYYESDSKRPIAQIEEPKYILEISPSIMEDLLKLVTDSKYGNKDEILNILNSATKTEVIYQERKRNQKETKVSEKKKRRRR